MEYYIWIKAFHIIAMVAWMAGLFYLPRLYVYHCQVKSKDMCDTFQIMEKKLLRYIMNPAMILTWVFGLVMVFLNIEYLMSSGWFHVKFLLVFILSGFHMALAKWRKDFAIGTNTKSEKFYRMVNEVPTLILIAVVILAVIKPF